MTTTQKNESKAVKAKAKMKVPTKGAVKAKPLADLTEADLRNFTPMQPLSVATLNKIPPTITGLGYKLVNMNTMERAVLQVEAPVVAEALYQWCSEVFPYEQVTLVSGGIPRAIALASIMSAPNLSELAEFIPQLADQLDKTVTVRRAVLAELAKPGAKVPFELLPELLAPYLNKNIMLRSRTDNVEHEEFVNLREVRVIYSFTGVFFQCKYAVKEWNDGNLKTAVKQLRLRPTGLDQTMHEWGFVLSPSDEQMERMLERGKRVVELNNKCAYISVKGNMEYQVGWWTRQAPATGRAIIDKVGHTLFNPNEREYDYDDEEDERSCISLEDFTADEIRLVAPYMTIFSFTAKRWGKIHINQVSDITFREDAFEKLVMPADDKNLVLSLVKNSDSSLVSDLIDNKGGGCVLLLHGKPGLGKTLTAEAVAEVLTRPLYAVSVGELGTNPATLEDKLNTVLQTAQRWNAVLLLDEADVFLEARQSGDIDRNAMVGTFLRLLEYYNGVLILTTNRVADMDQAFYSRISLALRYGDFDSGTREQVIRNLAATNGVQLTDSEVTTIGMMSVNGRQIKNSIRLARFMAKDEQRAVHAADIINVLEKLNDFQEAFSNAPKRT